MAYAACNVVYVDRAAEADGLVQGKDLPTDSPPHHIRDPALSTRRASLSENLHTLLKTFSEVHVCTSGKSCVSKLSELNQSSIVELIPTLVLIDIPHEDLDRRQSVERRTPSPGSRLQIEQAQGGPGIEEAYGIRLLKWIAAEIQYQSLSKLIVPVAIVSTPDSPDVALSREKTNSSSETSQPMYRSSSNSKKPAGLVAPLDPSRTMRYLDAGAVDVLTSPLLQERISSLGIHAYQAHRNASKDQRALVEMKRGRKRSWVGVDDQKPYAYLREAMVSGLMDGICTLGGDDEPRGPVRLCAAPDCRQRIAEAVGSWNFSAHDFTDDELLHAALLMLQHALTMPELERWRISTESLTGFLRASRSAYNAFVPYHNFRHVVDVLQATFYFLVQLRRLPPYPHAEQPTGEPAPSPIAALIRPFDALTLLITAIGHDVGHPGVNNAFLVTLNAPLAQLYNDRSVLESFHCAAYSQILRRHWPAAFQAVEMRQLMISSILATDMGLHFDYMKRLGWMQEKLHASEDTEGWNGRLLEEQRTLACSLLIKCADISNVARRFDIACQWTMILTDEFSRQAAMEQDLGIPTALFAAPVREIVELGKSQVGFMNMFAIPLFQGVTDVMPAMEFAVDELQRNKATWEERIQEEQAKAKQDCDDPASTDGMFSPRTMSVANVSDASYQQTARPNSDMGTRVTALLNKTPFSPPNDVIDESVEPTHHQSLPALSTTSPTDSNRSPSDMTPESLSRRSSKPSQLQSGFQLSSAPSRLDNPSREPVVFLDGESESNGVEIKPTHVTHQVAVHHPVGQGAKDKRPERGSCTTEGSNSAGGDSTSQTASATTGKTPVSPSTQGTSITSVGSVEKCHTPRLMKPRSSPSTPVKSSDGSSGRQEPYEGKGVLMGTVRNLKKRPSRFRMNSLNFWRRSKSSSPPMPSEQPNDKLGVGSEDDGSP